ncbi:TIGR03985 family CRISPR-associated protein [uncultured Nostoc sp.]|uniref:TIGR03985 family CRISPR-associated protein n=1 Tax=uncultured Nostoc sp. TaxID=340711 RepID=UPI0035CA09E4
MSTDFTQLFDYPPTVELLRTFLPSKAVLLEDNAFKKTWRIYIYLKTIYGVGVTLGNDKYIDSPLAGKNASYEFSFLDWLSQLDIYLSNQIPKQLNKSKVNSNSSKKQQKAEEREKAKENIDLLQKLTIEDIWHQIFYTQEERDKWIDDFKYFYKISETQVQQLLKLRPFDTQGGNFTNYTRLYRLDFQNSLANAQKTQWLKPIYDSNKKLTGNYCKVDSWLQLIPESLEQNSNQGFNGEVNSEYITNEELADFINKFARNTQKRLLFAAEFIRPANIKKQKYNALINTLELNWSKSDCVKPLKITYKKFKTSPVIITIIFPVIFYYIKRGPYLYAIRAAEFEESRYDWEGYRLDRILDVEILDWENEQIPVKLRELKDENELPTPEEVEDSLYADTLGYAFWKTQKMMFVRFERNHYRNYIQNTSRQKIFKEINFKNFQKLNSDLDKFFNNKEITLIFQSLRGQINEQYVFCIANFYEEDIDVFLRILSWGKNIKVILPFDLKEKIFQEIESTLKQYQEK